MAWVCVSKGGCELKFKNKSTRCYIKEDDKVPSFWGEGDNYEYLSKGSIKKLIGRELSWNDEPVKLKDE